jgi:metal-responsive CopG/Arc/MetJ family transcriptional regulator
MRLNGTPIAGDRVARYNATNMKTIAITIDEDTLSRLDELGGNRSRVIREAVREHLVRIERLASEQQEDSVIRRHRRRLARQAQALVRAQARP